MDRPRRRRLHSLSLQPERSECLPSSSRLVLGVFRPAAVRVFTGPAPHHPVLQGPIPPPSHPPPVPQFLPTWRRRLLPGVHLARGARLSLLARAHLQRLVPGGVQHLRRPDVALRRQRVHLAARAPEAADLPVALRHMEKAILRDGHAGEPACGVHPRGAGQVRAGVLRADGAAHPVVRHGECVDGRVLPGEGGRGAARPRDRASAAASAGGVQPPSDAGAGLLDDVAGLLLLACGGETS